MSCSGKRNMCQYVQKWAQRTTVSKPEEEIHKMVFVVSQIRSDRHLPYQIYCTIVLNLYWDADDLIQTLVKFETRIKGPISVKTGNHCPFNFESINWGRIGESSPYRVPTSALTNKIIGEMVACPRVLAVSGHEGGFTQPFHNMKGFFH